jgi:DNA-binding CsgD family transcriptional regulator
LVGLAMLNVLADLGAKQPLLVLVDDAQWLDQASAQTLSLVARRLQAESVGLLFAARDSTDQLGGLAELFVEGLAPEESLALLGAALKRYVDEASVQRFIAETQGNPLALLELSHDLVASDRACARYRRDSHHLWVRIEERFQQRIKALSPEAALLLLIAAADTSGDQQLLWHAAELLGLPPDAADVLQESGLLRLGPNVVLRHPLVRSACYRSASLDARRSVHRALAEAVDREVDPDRRALHRGLAAPGPDEEIAVELERSASRARTRGGYVAEAAFLERALTLTADADRRGARALATAQAKLASGEPRAARDLLAIAERRPLDALESVQLEVLRARIAFATGRGRDAPALLLKAAKSLEPVDPIGARDTYLDAMRAALFAGRFATDTNLRDVAVAVRGIVWPDTPRVPDLILKAFATLIVDGYSAGMSSSQRTVAALRDTEVLAAEDLGWLVLGAQLAVTLWDEEASDELTERQLRLARETGALDALPIALTNQAITHILVGDLTTATSLVEEIEVVSEATGTPLPPYAAVATAVYGHPDDALALIDTCLLAATDRGEGAAVKWIQLEKATLCNALGRYEDAWTAAASAYEDPVFYSAWIVSELIESGARSGHAEGVAEALEHLSEMASAARTDWVLGVEARCRALVGDTETADELYRRSIDHLQRTRRPMELARSHLVYGEWLRRQACRVAARNRLRTAREMFDALGAVAFADRASRELAATGETVQKRPSGASTRNEMTVRETQIARLAAEGLSNRDIGERLFISHRTVGYHLAKVFSKLEVTSRVLLRTVLDDSTLT